MPLPVPSSSRTRFRILPDFLFHIILIVFASSYVLFILALLVSDATYFSFSQLAAALHSPNVRFSIVLSLISCTISAALSVLVAVPLGFLLSRYTLAHGQLPAVGGETAIGWFFTATTPGRILLWLVTRVTDTIIDIPIVLPPLVLGISLLIFFQTRLGQVIEHASARWATPTFLYVLIPLALLAAAVWGLVSLLGLWTSRYGPIRGVCGAIFLLASLTLTLLYVLYFHDLRNLLFENLSLGISYTALAVIIAQFAVAAAFAVRTMRMAFDDISPRAEQIALTLGASRAQAFFRVVLPHARAGVLTSFTLAWARALGEFGPILIFAGTTRGRTEVLSSTVFLEFNVGQLDAAIAISLLMIALSIVVLTTLRLLSLNPLPRQRGLL